jgi:hypothetical protein
LFAAQTCDPSFLTLQSATQRFDFANGATGFAVGFVAGLVLDGDDLAIEAVVIMSISVIATTGPEDAGPALAMPPPPPDADPPPPKNTRAWDDTVFVKLDMLDSDCT